ncbi:MAG TPA: hypothetical protein VFA47_08715, partial [Candidatus Manganitrophaceae bacterium]|nr:hypothetical protein [Candidatus Manganitrophaceae bacterium]
MSTKAMMLAVFILFGMAALSAAGEGEKVSAAKLPKFIRQDPLDFILVARDDYYSPTYVQVKVKHGSVIRIENKGAKAHGLIIPAFRYQGVIL